MTFFGLLAAIFEILCLVLAGSLVLAATLLYVNFVIQELSFRYRVWTRRIRGLKLKDTSGDPADVPGSRRVICTARGEIAINLKAKSGLRPLVKPVVPSKDVFSTMTVFQNANTGEIKCGSHRSTYWMKEDGFAPIVNCRYYPHVFEGAVAAYMIPADLSVGESVWLEDIIEDIVSLRGPGFHGRLKSWSAIWDGTDFVIMFNQRIHATSFKG